MPAHSFAVLCLQIVYFFSPVTYHENYRDILFSYVGVLTNCMFYAPSAHKQEQHEKEDTPVK
jgi:hypothetical protein